MPPLQAALGRLWAETGDAVSVQYTGTANLTKGVGVAGGSITEEVRRPRSEPAGTWRAWCSQRAKKMVVVCPPRAKNFFE